MLFLLHGYSAEQHHLAAYVPLVDPDERFSAVCPRALHDLPEGDGASWWIRTATGPEPDSVRRAVEAVEALVAAETAARDIDRSRCVIGGFSQGGMLALAVATAAGARRFGGVWAMCCGRPDAAVVTTDPTDATGTPALIQYGTADAIVSVERATASDRKSTRLNSSHVALSRMPSSA